jgi:Contractile injection system tape measure protein
MHVRCAAASSEEQRALALRQRLERTARTHLPGALEPVLAGHGERIFVERLSVGLDFDPCDYDDVTVAALWAGRIGAALDGSDAGARTERVVGFASDREFDEAALAEFASTGRLGWIFEELGCGTGLVSAAEVAAAFAALGPVRLLGVVETLAAREELARGLYERLAPAERSRTLDRFAHVLDTAPETIGRAAETGLAPSGESSATQSRNGRPATAIAEGTDGAEIAPGDTHPGPDISWAVWTRALAELAFADFGRTKNGQASAPDASSAAEAEDAVPALREGATVDRDAQGSADAPADVAPSEPQRETDFDLTAECVGWWSRLGGLAFLYPWLADYLAEPPLPGLAAVEARLWAFAALAEPTDPSLVHDPLIRLLAGDDLEHDREEGPEPDGLDQLEQPAQAVLAAFAAALPGFGESTAGFVRAHFLARGALLEPLADERFRLVLEPAPFDPILDLLPYPVEAFRLRWSPVVVVRRRSRDAHA